ncbi:MFS general substrate transporter [Guyanagaster necrorhizus]|uniref:MFS general substrate transporter n=1 Tax=Guyanagaster necrorhizus TaxID=856835 RepID=A0A9P7VQY9_9AGAR|nr:MFS general substrate transporter [Guyanagaster necrorhizus MCA 3950]KAG7444386.1 MFS general substrate transporter [Guyanagaster necrorhizus MCA 3950]
MGSVTPRVSLLWSDEMDSYFVDDDDVEQQQLIDDGDDLDDERTPLDKTIDRIGMGSYQWTLLSLCGFGWMADNMWIQAVAIILPRVQVHYAVPGRYIGAVSSSLFCGMMFGAVGWGTCSDLMGRSTAFNATLFFTSLFGLLASLSWSYTSLCVSLFLLGTAVGGSMPTDGTLLLEHMPKGKQYLVTALSVFFSFGAVLSAIVALLIVPHHSCPPAPAGCNVDVENQGWKYLLIALGLITLSMFFARMVFFRLHESPRFLVHAGRHQEAVESLQMIARFNGAPLSLDLDDVEDVRPNVDQAPAVVPDTRPTGDDGTNSPRFADYHSTAESPAQQLESHSFATPTIPHQEPASPKEDVEPVVRPHRVSSRSRSLPRRGAPSVCEKQLYNVLPSWLRRPLWAWWDRILMVLTPEWLRTTLLVWGAWCAMSLAYTMFNVFLPKLLEIGKDSSGETKKSLEDSLWDVVIFTIGGCPGAIIGAYMIESSLGRRWSLAGSTFVTAIFCVVFVMVESQWAVRASTVGISLSATTMWAVLYGWTPEIFGTKVRGTACGIASALSRIGGMVAPLVGGMLLMIDRTVPVYTSVAVFVIAGVCVLFLKGREGHSMAKSERGVIH